MKKTKAALERAGALLAETFGGAVELDVLERFDSSHLVLRLAVQTRRAGLPPTVILKQRDLSAPRRPNDFDQNQLFANEWASLDFLSALESESPLGPRMYASDPAAGLVVLEDLGEAQTVQQALYSQDREAALAALIAQGDILGRLAAQTYGQEAVFHTRQADLGVSTPLSDANLDCRSRLDDLHACMWRLGLDGIERFDRALDALEEAIHDPGELRAFIHQDAGPHNFVLIPSGVTLLDYEFADFGHCLVDIACVRLAFPAAYRGRVLPPDVVAQVEARFRETAAQHIPALKDDALYHKALAQVSAHWAFSKLIGFWRNYLKDRLEKGESWDSREGRPLTRSAYFRSMVFTYLRLALDTLEGSGSLDEIRSALQYILTSLLEFWPETPLLGAYPAFGGPPWRSP